MPFQLGIGRRVRLSDVSVDHLYVQTFWMMPLKYRRRHTRDEHQERIGGAEAAADSGRSTRVLV